MAPVSLHSLLVLVSFFFLSVNGHLYNLDETNTAPLPVQTAAITLTPEQPNFNFDLETVLPSYSSTISNLTVLPDNCAAYNTATSECPGVMEASNVTFDDCGTPFTICRCTTANMTLSDAVDKLGRVPVGLRRYVNTIVLLSDSEPHAYTLTTGDIHMFAFTEMDTWIHESAHAYDYATSTPISGSVGWLEALGNDTCVPDEYSQTNAIEDFAQVTVLKTFALTHGGNYPPGYSTACMSNQLAFMDSLELFDTTTLFGNTCNINDNREGAKHTEAPATLRTTNSYPMPWTADPAMTATPVPSGFQKVAVPVPTVVAAAGASPNIKNHGGPVVSPVGLLPLLVLVGTFLVLL